MDHALPAHVAEARHTTLSDIAASGARLATRDGGSVELLGYTTGMSNPLARIGAGARPLNTVGAVARFVWLIAGSDRLEDIAYYEAKVRGFTDDKISVPGSSYGKRIFNAAPGTNQMAGVVAALLEDPFSRRAAAVVWLPEDAVRTSNDIPCTFGLFFHIRDGGLIMTTVMRSNNAVLLLPYNFFEFSLLGELVAAQVNVPFTTYVHWAASMHTVDKQNQMRDLVLSDDPQSIEMPAMPRGDALQAAHAIAVFEARLRNASTAEELSAIAGEARAELDEYWVAFFDVLYVYGLAKRDLRDAVEKEIGSIPEFFLLGARKYINEALRPEQLKTDPQDDGLFILDQVLPDSDAAHIARAVSLGNDLESLMTVLEGYSTGDQPVTVPEMKAVRDLLNRQDFALAARGGGAGEQLTPEAIADALTEVRKNQPRA